MDSYRYYAEQDFENEIPREKEEQTKEVDYLISLYKKLSFEEQIEFKKAIK